MQSKAATENQTTGTITEHSGNTPLPYSSLAPGHGVTWESQGDGIVIRVTRAEVTSGLRGIEVLIIFPILALELFLLARVLRIFALFVGIPVLVVSALVLRRLISKYLVPQLVSHKWLEQATPKQPVVLEVRSGLLFIHQPDHPAAFPKIWDHVLADYSASTIVPSTGFLESKSSMGELQLVPRLDTPYHKHGSKLIDGEIAQLELVARVLQPWLEAAKNNIPSWSPEFKAPPEYFHPSRHEPPPPVRIESSKPAEAQQAPFQLRISVRASALVRQESELSDAIGCIAAIVALAAWAIAFGTIFAAHAGAFGGRPPFSLWIPAGVFLAGVGIVAITLGRSQASKNSPPRTASDVELEIRDGLLHCYNPNGGLRNRQVTLPLVDITDLRGIANPKASHQCGRLMIHLKDGKQVELITHQRVADLKQIMGHLRKHINCSHPSPLSPSDLD